VEIGNLVVLCLSYYVNFGRELTLTIVDVCFFILAHGFLIIIRNKLQKCSDFSFFLIKKVQLC